MIEEIGCGKINLALAFTGRRDDGYHDIDTIFQSIGLHDVIRLEEADEFLLTCSNSALACDETNLAYKAYKALLPYRRGPKGVCIHIEKNIPVAAGLAGGSTDCAAVLRGLNRLWRLGLTPEELCRIITRSAALMGMRIDADGAMELASRSRGTPRIANRMLRRVRDFAQLYYDGVITREAADHALGKLEVDKLGLDATDRRMLTAIIRYYNGGPVGLETLAATIGEEAVTLEDVYEPYLMQIGFLTRTPRGRCVTQLAYDHLHLQNNNAEQLTL